MKAPTNLHTTPTALRSAPARGEPPTVEFDGGDNGAGLIRQFSVITAGEAKGHGVWIDNVFVDSVAAAMATGAGTKSRFAHPSLSADGLGTYLGRAKNPQGDGRKLAADLHLGKTAHRTPDGDLADYVMGLASEDAAAFGASIVFEGDIGEEERHRVDHTDAAGAFQSPDPANVQNLPHVRLGKLKAVDVVDSPAANPEGLFHRQTTPAEADALAAYALGLTKELPVLTTFALDPDRVAAFVAKFLDAHNLKITKKEPNVPKTTTPDVDTVDELDTADELETAAPAPDLTEPAVAPETTDENLGIGTPDPVDPLETVAPADPPEDPKAQLARYVEIFGAERASDIFTAGTPYVEALETCILELREAYKSALTMIDQLGGDADGVTFAADEDLDPAPDTHAADEARLAQAVGKPLAAYASRLKLHQ